MVADITTIDDYIASCAETTQPILEKLRATIREAAPGAGERISYQIPTITLDGRYLLYFAAWKHHVAIYPVPTMESPLEDDVAPYRSGKSTLRFPYSEPIPYDLVARLVAVLRERSDTPDQ